jgi:hypothetical protein
MLVSAVSKRRENQILHKTPPCPIFGNHMWDRSIPSDIYLLIPVQLNTAAPLNLSKLLPTPGTSGNNMVNVANEALLFGLVSFQSLALRIFMMPRFEPCL